MSHQTCTIAQATKDQLQALRFRKEKTNACLVLKIKDLSIVVDEMLEDVQLDTIKEELGTSPLYLVMSYELKHKDGRVSYPMVGIYYNPVNASISNRMLYASSSTLIFQEASIQKVFDLQESDELTDEWLIKKLEQSKTRP